jgi:hypothetical protein
MTWRAISICQALSQEDWFTPDPSVLERRERTAQEARRTRVANTPELLIRASHTAVNALAPGRGLHSFPFQLNLSSSVHHITHINS